MPFRAQFTALAQMAVDHELLILMHLGKGRTYQQMVDAADGMCDRVNSDALLSGAVIKPSQLQRRYPAIFPKGKGFRLERITSTGFVSAPSPRGSDQYVRTLQRPRDGSGGSLCGDACPRHVEEDVRSRHGRIGMDGHLPNGPAQRSQPSRGVAGAERLGLRSAHTQNGSSPTTGSIFRPLQFRLRKSTFRAHPPSFADSMIWTLACSLGNYMNRQGQSASRFSGSWSACLKTFRRSEITSARNRASIYHGNPNRPLHTMRSKTPICMGAGMPAITWTLLRIHGEFSAKTESIFTWERSSVRTRPGPPKFLKH